MSALTLTYQNQRIDLLENETLLEGLEKLGVDISWQCREGICGSCRCHLIKGAVHYHTPPLGCIEEGEILPCIALMSESCTVAIL